MYKIYIETKHENRDRLGPSEMGYAGYLLTRPRISRNTAFPTRSDARPAKIHISLRIRAV